MRPVRQDRDAGAARQRPARRGIGTGPPATGWAAYSSVWSSISASEAFFLTDSIPFRADALRSYVSLVAMTCPLEATRLRWYLPLEPFLSTNWHEQFEVTLPGSAWDLTRALRRFLQACADGLAADAAAGPRR